VVQNFKEWAPKPQPPKSLSPKFNPKANVDLLSIKNQKSSSSPPLQVSVTNKKLKVTVKKSIEKKANKPKLVCKDKSQSFVTLRDLAI
jgi:hypothetical protein